MWMMDSIMCPCCNRMRDDRIKGTCACGYNANPMEMIAEQGRLEQEIARLKAELAEARGKALEEAAKVCDHSEAEYKKLTGGRREAVDELWACQQEAGALAGQIRRLAHPLDDRPAERNE